MKHILCSAGGTHSNIDKPNKKIHTNTLFHLGFVEVIPLTTLRCPQRGSFQPITWQLNQNNQHTSTYSRIQQQTKNPYYATIHNEHAQ